MLAVAFVMKLRGRRSKRSAGDNQIAHLTSPSITEIEIFISLFIAFTHQMAASC